MLPSLVNVLLTALNIDVVPETLAGALNALFLLALIFTPSAAIKIQATRRLTRKRSDGPTPQICQPDKCPAGGFSRDDAVGWLV